VRFFYFSPSSLEKMCERQINKKKATLAIGEMKEEGRREKRMKERKKRMKKKKRRKFEIKI